MSQNNEQTKILKEILTLIKISSYREISELLKLFLDTDTKKLIYQFSDGTNNTTEVVKNAKSSAQTVSDCWKLWKKIGIGETIDVPGGKRFKRIFDLNNFGILPTSNTKKSPKETK